MDRVPTSEACTVDGQGQLLNQPPEVRLPGLWRPGGQEDGLTGATGPAVLWAQRAALSHGGQRPGLAQGGQGLRPGHHLQRGIASKSSWVVPRAQTTLIGLHVGRMIPVVSPEGRDPAPFSRRARRQPTALLCSAPGLSPLSSGASGPRPWQLHVLGAGEVVNGVGPQRGTSGSPPWRLFPLVPSASRVPPPSRPAADTGKRPQHQQCLPLAASPLRRHLDTAGGDDGGPCQA